MGVLRTHTPRNQERSGVVDAIKASTRRFLGGFFRQADLADDTDMFASGFVNSLFAMQLILFVEAEFAIQVEDTDLELDNFRSLDAIERFVTAKRAAADACDAEGQPDAADRTTVS